MKSRWLTLFLMIIAAALATTKFAFDLSKARQPGKAISVACPDLRRACQFNIHGQPATVSFSPGPLLLKPFMLIVQAQDVRSVSADFAMNGMDMGPNRYRLEPGASGAWQAKIVLPVCTAGQSDWILTLDIDGQKVRVPFAAEK